MTDEVTKALNLLAARVAELEEVQGAHRALISRHQSALKTVAHIMEIGTDVVLARPSPDSPAPNPNVRS